MYGMNERKSVSESFYGSVTIGERGQIVIPAEARQELGFKPGDKVLVMQHPEVAGLIICKIDTMRELMNEFEKILNEAENADLASSNEVLTV